MKINTNVKFAINFVKNASKNQEIAVFVVKEILDHLKLLTVGINFYSLYLINYLIIKRCLDGYYLPK